MLEYLLDDFKNSIIFKIISLIFILLVAYWAYLLFSGLSGNPEFDYFTLIYPLLALIGGVIGMRYALKWGGFKSVLGKAIAYLSLGLLAQFIGQILYNYYVYVLGVEIPYPSVGDISYFASVILYIIGVVYLAKVSGFRLAVNSLNGKVLAFIVPVVMLFGSYILLLRGYEFESTSFSLLFLDFGFPIGQAIFVSVALLIFFISKNILGGMMRRPIVLLTIALILQFLADFLFSYLFSIGKNVYSLDILYLLAYFLMTIALFSIGNMFYKVQKS